MNRKGELLLGRWVVGFIDLLGQKEAFLKTDFLPDGKNPEQEKALIAAVKDSLGVVRLFHDLVASLTEHDDATSFAADSPLRSLPVQVQSIARRAKRHRVRDLRWSDGVVLYSPLWDDAEHSATMGMCVVIQAAVILALVQLSIGKPIRGGLDVGTGIETDNQLFGAGLVKAYTLESKDAQYPRILIGQKLVDTLDEMTSFADADPEVAYWVHIAKTHRAFIVMDEDHNWILDFAGPQARAILQTAKTFQLFQNSQNFVRAARERFLAENNTQLFDRYSRLARYLDARAHLWVSSRGDS
jgi:hypothetical protein